MTSATTGATNRSYIFEDELYAGMNSSRKDITVRNGKPLTHRSVSTDSHILVGSLDHRLVTDLYAKPMKAKKNKQTKSMTSLRGGFVDNREEPFGRNTVHLDNDDDIYGYTTSLA